MLKRREAVVEHSVRDVEVGELKVGAALLVVEHLEILTAGKLGLEPCVETGTQVVEIPDGQNGQQGGEQQYDGDSAVLLGLLHRAAVVGKAVVGRQFLI